MKDGVISCIGKDIIMDKVTEVKKRYCTEQWRAMILECRQSDMTVKAFCKMKGFSEAAYYRHLKKIQRGTDQSIA